MTPAIGQHAADGREVGLSPTEAIEVIQPRTPPCIIELVRPEGFFLRVGRGSEDAGSVLLAVLESRKQTLLPLGRILVLPVLHLKGFEQEEVSSIERRRQVAGILAAQIIQAEQLLGIKCIGKGAET